MKPAITLREAFQATDPRPLTSGDPYYVDLSAARNSSAAKNLRRRVENCAQGQFSAIAFCGHRGSGKSTELRQLQQALSGACFSLYLDALDSLDPADVDYTDLFLLLAREILDELAKHNIHLSGSLLKEVEDWFRSVTKETEESVKLSAGVSVEADAGVKVPFLAKLLAKLTADVQAGSSNKTTTRRELDHYFSGLLANTNALLSSASQALKNAGKPSQILVLMDNLDRMDSQKSEKLFFTHGSQLQDLACHAVYTVSIETYYDHKGLGNVFASRDILPNIKFRQNKSEFDSIPAWV